MNSVVTNKGTNLPLTNLKGKQYLMVAYRIQWFNEEVPEFNIETDFPLITDEQTVARAKVEVLKDRRVIRRVTATKRETKKDFNDHTEKAETAAIGRALVLLGYGTQFALTDLDEGERIVDSPVVNTQQTPADATAKSTSFRRQPKKDSSITTPTTTPSLTVVQNTGSEWEN